MLTFFCVFFSPALGRRPRLLRDGFFNIFFSQHEVFLLVLATRVTSGTNVFSSNYSVLLYASVNKRKYISRVSGPDIVFSCWLA